MHRFCRQQTIYLFILYHKLPENSWLVFWVLLRLKAVTLELVLVAFRSKCNLKTTGCLLTVNKTWCILELFIWKPQLVTFGDLVCLSFVVVVFFLFLLTSCNIRTHVTIFAVIVSVFDTMLLLSRFNCQVSSSWMSSFKKKRKKRKQKYFSFFFKFFFFLIQFQHQQGNWLFNLNCYT